MNDFLWIFLVIAAFFVGRSYGAHSERFDRLHGLGKYKENNDK